MPVRVVSLAPRVERAVGVRRQVAAVVAADVESVAFSLDVPGCLSMASVAVADESTCDAERERKQLQQIFSRQSLAQAYPLPSIELDLDISLGNGYQHPYHA